MPPRRKAKATGAKETNSATNDKLRLYYINKSPPSFLDGEDKFRNLQTYFPTLEVLFPSLHHHHGGQGKAALAALEMAVTVSGDTAVVENQLTHRQREVPVWFRPVHLLPPLDCLEGLYTLPIDGALPAPRDVWQNTLHKINNPLNEAYTDAVFACMASRLVETGLSPHWCRFYGTMNGRADRYGCNVTDDMEHIQDKDWFRSAIAEGACELWTRDPFDPSITEQLDVTTPFLFGSGRGQKELVVGDEIEMDDVADIQEAADAEGSGSSSTSYSSSVTDLLHELEDLSIGSTSETDTVTVNIPSVRLVRAAPAGTKEESVTDDDEEKSVTDDEDDEESTDEDDDDDDEESVTDDEEDDEEDDEDDTTEGEDDTTDSDDYLDYQLVMKDFPIQLTLIEKCDGTLDQLMENEFDPETVTDDMRATKEARWTAWMFQIIAALTVAQREYNFVHNDLHTNNVLWCGTGETHMYYHILRSGKGKEKDEEWYRVPTYGRLMKIIDFGRATFQPPGQKHVWLSDAYAPGADAWGQYNCEPYLKKKEPRVAPNPAFDLCRLAVAILDSLWPSNDHPPPRVPERVLTEEDGRTTLETVSPLWNLLWRWLTDKTGRNLLKNPDDSERYPQFSLYCAIARDAVHSVPADQLLLPLFADAFRTTKKEIPADATVWELCV